MMEYVSVVSQAIDQVGYDKDEGVMEIVFSSGSVYRYAGVPLWRFNAFVNSPSAGSYFYNVIKPTYQGRRIS